MATRRNLLWLLLALAALIGLVVALAFYIQSIRPPRLFRIAAGAKDGLYFAGAKQISDAVAKHGFEAKVMETGGSGENLQLLKTGQADIAIIQGGVAQFTDTTGLTTLAMVGYEPIWLFYRRDRFSPDFRGNGTAGLQEIRGKRISLGVPGSGAQLIGLKVLELIGLSSDDLMLAEEGMTKSAQMLHDGELDAALFITPAANPIIVRLAGDPRMELRTATDSKALSRQIQAFNDITLERGVLDLKNRLPAEDIPLVGLRIAVVARAGIHPDLARLVTAALPTLPLLTAPSKVGQRFEFPNLNNPEIPANPDAALYFREGPTPLERVLPFEIASPLSRAYLLLLPLLVFAIPIWSLIKAVYNWYMKSRIVNWYPQILAIERQLSRYTLPEVDEKLAFLRNLDDEISQRIRVSAGYMQSYYQMRGDVRFVINRLEERRQTLLGAMSHNDKEAPTADQSVGLPRSEIP